MDRDKEDNVNGYVVSGNQVKLPYETPQIIPLLMEDNVHGGSQQIAENSGGALS